MRHCSNIIRTTTHMRRKLIKQAANTAQHIKIVINKKLRIVNCLPPVHASVIFSPPTEQPLLQHPVSPQFKQQNFHLFPLHEKHENSRARGHETTSLPANSLAQFKGSRKQLNFVPQTPNSSPHFLPGSPTINCSLPPQRTYKSRHPKAQCGNPN